MSPLGSNSGRVEAARFALRSYQWAKGDLIEEGDGSIIDLLTDLRHYCDANGITFSDCNRIAEDHHSVETEPGDS